MKDFIYGKLNNEEVLKEYSGDRTNTATTTVNNIDNIISVDVQKTKGTLKVNKETTEILNFNGSEDKSITIDDTFSLDSSNNNNLNISVAKTPKQLTIIDSEGNRQYFDGSQDIKLKITANNFSAGATETAQVNLENDTEHLNNKIIKVNVLKTPNDLIIEGKKDTISSNITFDGSETNKIIHIDENTLNFENNIINGTSNQNEATLSIRRTPYTLDVDLGNNEKLAFNGSLNEEIVLGPTLNGTIEHSRNNITGTIEKSTGTINVTKVPNALNIKQKTGIDSNQQDIIENRDNFDGSSQKTLILDDTLTSTTNNNTTKIGVAKTPKKLTIIDANGNTKYFDGSVDVEFDIEKEYSYGGAITDTTDTKIDIENNTISVDVLKTPYALSITQNGTTTSFDGSQAQSLTISNPIGEDSETADVTVTDTNEGAKIKVDVLKTDKSFNIQKIATGNNTPITQQTFNGSTEKNLILDETINDTSSGNNIIIGVGKTPNSLNLKQANNVNSNLTLKQTFNGSTEKNLILNGTLNSNTEGDNTTIGVTQVPNNLIMYFTDVNTNTNENTQEYQDPTGSPIELCTYNGSQAVNPVVSLHNVGIELLDLKKSKLNKTQLVNNYSSNQTDIYNSNYINSNFAPLSFTNALYLLKDNLGAYSLTIDETAPTISNDNIITENSTNSTYTWSINDNPNNFTDYTLIAVRTLEQKLTLNKSNVFTIELPYKVSTTQNISNTDISFGARVKVKGLNDNNYTYISTNQAFSVESINLNWDGTNAKSDGVTAVFSVKTDLINGTATYDIGALFEIEIFEMHTNENVGQNGITNDLTYDFYFGVEVNGAIQYSILQFNFASVSINTNQIEDGSVTYNKLDTNLKGQIDSIQHKQETLVSGTNIKTINNNNILGNGNLYIGTYQAFPNTWTTNETTATFCNQVNADNTALVGMAYLGGVTFSDLPFNGNGDLVVEILEGPNNTKSIHLILTSGTNAPYRWEYTYWNDHTQEGWIGFQPALVSGTNIKTINNNSILGSGDLSLPNSITVNNITTLTATQLDNLKCEDVVIKVTGDSKHTYTVAYKDSVNGELSLVYSDHENIEEVYYEKQNNVWTYIQTDITPITGKQDTLAIQTTYTSQGDATHVPQITTNNLGQVTNITQVAITQPVVNDGILTIKTNGTNKGTFGANNSANVEINITPQDLGLSSAIQFIGISSTDPVLVGATVSGHTEWNIGEVVLYNRVHYIEANPQPLDQSDIDNGTYYIKSGNNYIATNIYSNGTIYYITTTGYEEYINLDGNNTSNSWELIGDADSYALNSITISTGSGLEGGGDLTQNRQISLSTAYGDIVNPYGNKIANYVLASPNGSNGTPLFRALEKTDLPLNSETAVQNGTTTSLVTTGEKYTWNNKQDSLNTQTAYTNQGDATHVPQITTNSLGQVTGITQVAITQPIVNNATLDIKVEGVSKGTFTANSASNVDINITASDLGLSSALKYVGTGSTIPPQAGEYIQTQVGVNIYYISITNNGTAEEIPAQKGDVIVIGTKEYVCNTSGLHNQNVFQEIGDESSFALKTVTISAGTGLTGGGTLEADRTLSLADNYGDTKNPYASKTANYVLAAPNGNNGVPTFRALTLDDIPVSSQSASQGGTTASLVTTGEKYNWDAKQDALTPGTGIQIVTTTQNGSTINTISVNPDNALNGNSTNVVQNAIVTRALSNISLTESGGGKLTFTNAIGTTTQVQGGFQPDNASLELVNKYVEATTFDANLANNNGYYEFNGSTYVIANPQPSSINDILNTTYYIIEKVLAIKEIYKDTDTLTGVGTQSNILSAKAIKDTINGTPTIKGVQDILNIETNVSKKQLKIFELNTNIGYSIANPQPTSDTFITNTYYTKNGNVYTLQSTYSSGVTYYVSDLSITTWTNTSNTGDTADLYNLGFIYTGTITIPLSYQSTNYDYLNVNVNLSTTDSVSGNYAPEIWYDETLYKIYIFSKTNTILTPTSILCIPIKN